MIKVSEAMGPIVTFTWRDGLLDDDLDFYLAHCEQILNRRQPYAVVINLNLSPGLSPTQIKKFFRIQHTWIQANESTLKALCLGMVFRVNALASQAIVLAHLRLRPTPFPVLVVENSQQAETWATHRFEAAASSW